MKSLRGFTLVEMAIVLVLFGIVASMGLKMVNATLDNSAYSETKAKQERIKIALIGFLRTNGRLPCPDIATTPTGIEPAPAVGCATAASGYGVLPWATLGLARDAALDGRDFSLTGYLTITPQHHHQLHQQYQERRTPIKTGQLKPAQALLI